ncbi:homoserine O-succinyltransferase [Tetragenococcus osmophilus]|uniref:Homoserine O-acetyltransferase n=1 Tax=Tetragenococcus osmophilus TaxID=526944 RepID=A0AA38CWV6_9ENTE|nr:homoserine O-succinyltransferase [Tetragenococcus osmophilus]AYW47239.1 homoserine O-succinyltransferase [Tetragenococcus osmophilus]GMA52757.1 homoserine O-succinyltransferase [Alicyclobacillus contaminans]GMA73238.1 homoserine O-succinyltransferase [Tetragenococcus osmophilus]
MPLKLANDLPVKQLLEKENIFALKNDQALQQDIRPLKIAILNLMPGKIETELQLLRLLSQSPLQIDIDFIQMKSHTSKHTDITYLNKYYLTFDQIKAKYFDGLIITGAPIEQLAFEEVDYWKELTEVLKWSQTHTTSTLHICWGAQAALYYHYGINKTKYSNKLFGVYENSIIDEHPLLRGFSDVFFAPQSRYTSIDENQVAQAPITVLTENKTVGSLMLVSNDQQNVFILGHMEYDTQTLHDEYQRDQSQGLSTTSPKNYYFGSPKKENIKNQWRSEAYLFYHNWLNDIYQRTPYEFIGNISE